MNEIQLAYGAHDTREEGMCAMEFVAWVANEPHSDKPKCVDPDLREFMMQLNDRLSSELRQSLRPFLGRCIGTAGDGSTTQRRALLQSVAPNQRINLPVAAANRVAAYDHPDRIAFLETLLPTEELPHVTAAIAEKCAA